MGDTKSITKPLKCCCLKQNKMKFGNLWKMSKILLWVTAWNAESLFTQGEVSGPSYDEFFTQKMTGKFLHISLGEKNLNRINLNIWIFVEKSITRERFSKFYNFRIKNVCCSLSSQDLSNF